MKRYKNFPHTREAAKALGMSTAGFDVEDIQERVALDAVRKTARLENEAYEMARSVVNLAYWESE